MAFTTNGQPVSQMQAIGMNVVVQSSPPLAPSAPSGNINYVPQQNVAVYNYVPVSPQSPSNGSIPLTTNGVNMSPRSGNPGGNMLVNVSVGEV